MVIHRSALPATVAENATAFPSESTHSCITKRPSYATVLHLDDPSAADDDIAADVAELLDGDPRDYTPAQLERLNDPAYRIVVDRVEWQRLREERRV